MALTNLQNMFFLDVPDPLSSPSLEDFSIVCRFCLRKSRGMQMQPIGAYVDKMNSENVVDLWEKIKMCSDIEISKGDDLLPNNICDKCVNLVLVAHYFRVLSATSDRILRRVVTFRQEGSPLAAVKVESNNQQDCDDTDGYIIQPPSDIHHTEKKYLDLPEYTYTVSSNPILICDICHIKFYDKSSLSDHINNKCYGCVDSIPFDSKVETRTESKQDDSLHIPKDEAIQIGIDYIIIKGKENKIDIAETTYYFECLNCNTSFVCKKELSRHMCSHNKCGKYKCHGCEAVFNKFSERTHHEKYYCPKMPPGTKYECRKCDAKSENRFKFDAHMKAECIQKKAVETNNMELKPLLKCEHCTFTTVSKWNLNYHILNCHTADKPHICEVCGKRYAIRWRLTKHYKQCHQPREKKYKCVHCPYASVDSSSLRVHNRRHTLEYRFSCDICGASFKHSSGYHNHVRRYHKEKEHQCEFCKRMFSLKASLKSHIASVHLGIKPYECKDCRVAFSRKRSLRDHLLRVHQVVEGVVAVG